MRQQSPQLAIVGHLRGILSKMSQKWTITTVIALVAIFIASTGYMTMTLNGRMTGIDNRLNRVEDRLYRVEDKIDRLDAKFDQLLLALAGRGIGLPLEGKRP